MFDQEGPIEVLDEEQCWKLLASTALGRLAVSVAGTLPPPLAAEQLVRACAPRIPAQTAHSREVAGGVAGGSRAGRGRECD